MAAGRSDLTESELVAATLEMMGEYGLGDLVQLDTATAGVVVRIEKDAARVRPEGADFGTSEGGLAS